MSNHYNSTAMTLASSPTTLASPSSTHSHSSSNPTHLIPPHVLLPPIPPYPHKTYLSYISTWNETEVASFLSHNRCAHHARCFADNDIVGGVILELGEGDLKELGVGKVGERVRLISGIRALKKRCAALAGPGLSRGITLNASMASLRSVDSGGRSSPIPDRQHSTHRIPTTGEDSIGPYTSQTVDPAPPPSRQHAQNPARPQLRLNDDALNLSSHSHSSMPNDFPLSSTRSRGQYRPTERNGPSSSGLHGIGTPFSLSSLSRSSSLSSDQARANARNVQGIAEEEARARLRERDRSRPGTSSGPVTSGDPSTRDYEATEDMGVEKKRDSAGSRRLNANRPPPLHLSGSTPANGRGVATTDLSGLGSGDSGLARSSAGGGNLGRAGNTRERQRDGRVEIGSADQRERERERERERDRHANPATGDTHASRYAQANGLSSATQILAPFGSSSTTRGVASQPLATSASVGSTGSSGSGGSLGDYLSSAIIIGQHTPSSGAGFGPLLSGRPSTGSGTSGSLTVTPGTLSMGSSSSGSSSSATTGNVPGPLPSSVPPASGLRAQPLNTAIALALSGRRSPSPALGPGDASSFADRPLPGIPSLISSPVDPYPAMTRGFGERRANLAAARQQAGGRPSTSGQIGMAERSKAPAQRQHRRSGSLLDEEASAVAAFGRASHSRPSRPSTSGAVEGGTVDTPSSNERHPYANPDLRSTGSKFVNGLRVQPGESSPHMDRFAATPTMARYRTGSMDISRGQTNAQMTLEDVRRKCVKFILADDGSSRVVNLDTCEGGMEVLEKALKKFGKWKGVGISHGGSESEGEGDETTSLSVDGWGVFLSEFDDENEMSPLTEAELLAICHADPDDPSRQNGLWLRRLRRSANRKDITTFLGENAPMSPTSPSGYHPNSATRMVFPSPTSDKLHRPRNLAVRNVNRASVISVMSGLGVPIDEAATPSAQQDFPAPARSPSTGNFLASKGKRMYNFFGHRPPSELISNHLADFFPAARRRDLKKGARNSMLRLDGKGSNSGSDVSNSNRASYGSGSHRDSLEAGPTPNRLPSRFSVASSSASSARLSRTSMSLTGSPAVPAATIPEEKVADVPRLSVSTGEGGEVPQTGSSRSAPLLPPFESEKESLSESLKVYSPEGSIANPRHRMSHPSNRISMASAMKRRRRSNASLLTVDEITAEVDYRRASVISFGGSDDEAEEEIISGKNTAKDPGIAPLTGGEEGEEQLDDEDEEEFESDSDDGDEEEEEEEEDEGKTEGGEQGQKFTSAGANRSIKWSKGALIGSGSFGQVYLGLDLQKGLLMAVKQVDISTGGNISSENRKQEMVTALQREVELLKELQHENIVQYLDSSTDESHLNIFLEYVPGGSVTALLRNYGAFEEDLVRTFVRQILTGLQYLHDKGIIHRDIKGANILVDNKGGVKISDFGISKKTEKSLLSGIKVNRPSLQGSAFWMAPEVVTQKAHTNKADIWGLGCLVLEMLTGEHPWPDLNQMQALFRIGSPSPRPTLPADICADATDMLNRSFEIDYLKRPSAKDLLAHPFLKLAAE